VIQSFKVALVLSGIDMGWEVGMRSHVVPAGNGESTMNMSAHANAELSDHIQDAVKNAPASAITLAWQLVIHEIAAATSQNGVASAATFVETVRRLRDENCIDRVFANDLEKLVRMLRHSEAVQASGREIDRRNARQYVTLAMTAAEKLHNLHFAA
jgi:hypothetical protein